MTSFPINHINGYIFCDDISDLLSTKGYIFNIGVTLVDILVIKNAIIDEYNDQKIKDVIELILQERIITDIET